MCPGPSNALAHTSCTAIDTWTKTISPSLVTDWSPIFYHFSFTCNLLPSSVATVNNYFYSDWLRCSSIWIFYTFSLSISMFFLYLVSAPCITCRSSFVAISLDQSLYSTARSSRTGFGWYCAIYSFMSKRCLVAFGKCFFYKGLSAPSAIYYFFTSALKTTFSSYCSMYNSFNFMGCWFETKDGKFLI